MSGCGGYTARSGSDVISPKVPCTSPVTATVTAGCLHEHVGDRDLCDYHATDARAGIMLCGDCLDSSIPHECRLRVMAETAPAGALPLVAPGGSAAANGQVSHE